jgi:hypothetical protein
MMKWSTNRVNPAVAARTTMPGMTRQSTAARAQFRPADMQRGAALAQRGAAKDEDKDKESLFNRDEDKDKDEDDLDEAAIAPDDNETDDEPDEDKDNVIIVVS